MATTRTRPAKPAAVAKKPTRYPSRWLIGLASVGLLVLFAQVGRYFYRLATTPNPPQVPSGHVDPAIVQEIAEARQNVVEHPTSAVSWGHLGMCFLANDFWQDASTCLREAERLDSSEPRWPYFESIASHTIDFSATLPQLKRAVSLSPEDALAPRLRLGELLLEQGDLEGGEQMVRQVLKRDSKNARALLDLGQIQLAKGDVASARESLVASATSNPNVKATHTALANVYGRLSQASAAQAEEKVASRLLDEPFWPDPWYEELDALRTGAAASLSRADLLIKQGRWIDAVGPLQQICRQYPSSSRAWMTLGMALQLQGDLDGAEEALRRAVSIDPERADVQMTLATVLLRRDRFSEAEGAVRKALDLQPDLGDGWYVLGVVLEKQGKLRESIEPLRRAIQLEPNVSDPHIALAQALWRLGQPREARQELEHALAISPQDAKAAQLIQQLPPEKRPAK